MKGPASYQCLSQDESKSSKSSDSRGIEKVPTVESYSKIVKETKCIKMSLESGDSQVVQTWCWSRGKPYFRTGPMQLRWFSTNEMLEHHPRSQPETDWKRLQKKHIASKLSIRRISKKNWGISYAARLVQVELWYEEDWRGLSGVSVGSLCRESLGARLDEQWARHSMHAQLGLLQPAQFQNRFSPVPMMTWPFLGNKRPWRYIWNIYIYIYL